MNYAVRIALIAALGGFLFGFETAVISGAEKTIQQLWSLTLLAGIYRGVQPDRNRSGFAYSRYSRTEIREEKSFNFYCHNLPVICDWLCRFPGFYS